MFSSSSRTAAVSAFLRGSTRTLRLPSSTAHWNIFSSLSVRLASMAASLSRRASAMSASMRAKCTSGFLLSMNCMKLMSMGEPMTSTSMPRSS